MVTKKIAALAQLQAEAAVLSAQIEKERTSELAALPGNYGFDSLAGFIKALKAAYGSAGRKTGKRRGRPAGSGKAKATKGAGKRGKITDEMRAAVKSMVADGKTGAEIAKALGISMPSVQNIKKSFGLVKARAPKTAATGGAAA
jgi:DNA-binding NarL/FixJ family response regulator